MILFWLLKYFAYFSIKKNHIAVKIITMYLEGLAGLKDWPLIMVTIFHNFVPLHFSDKKKMKKKSQCFLWNILP